jgi:hypothetical protein
MMPTTDELQAQIDALTLRVHDLEIRLTRFDAHRAAETAASERVGVAVRGRSG